MAKTKKQRPRIWRTLLIATGGLAAFLLLFVAAFVFNPFEPSLSELRDIVPRGVNFFVRKQRLADDFSPFPVPRFWPELAELRGFAALREGDLGRSWQQAGLDRALGEAAEAFEKIRRDSMGFVDVLRDVLGTELVVAGYEQDYTQTPPRPLAQPWWCIYTRVTWRIKALFGLCRFGFVQGRLQANGLDVSSDGELLVVRTQGMRDPFYVHRHRDVLLIANHRLLIDQAELLIAGNRDEEPIGQMPAYTDGALQRIDRWAAVNGVDRPNVIEFVVEPNAFDGFRRFASSWPNPQKKDSMNERVLASFLNLKGWMQITGGLMFAEGVFGATGQIGLNSKQHTPFQNSFYSAEQQRREEWLDPFLRMVPESACGAAALRMPAGEFLHAMFDALEEEEKSLVNDGLRRALFQGNQLNDMRDLIERVRIAFLGRTGFVFRRNTPDMSRDEQGELMVPVAARSPMPQVAWIFWLRPGGTPLVEELVTMLRTYYATFGFRRVWHLRVPFEGGAFTEPVTEFTNPQIPATGELAMVVFRDFFVMSNSGPLIRDILRTRYGAQTRARSVRDLPEFQEAERELPAELNALIWLSGPNLLPVIDDYIGFADTSSAQPDQEWMMLARPAAEEQVRRTRFPQYPNKAGMPRSLLEGDFEQAVIAYLRDKWTQERTTFTAADRASLQQFRGASQLLKAAAIQLELQKNYIRFQARLMPDVR